MPTTSDYVAALTQQKNNLSSILNSLGVEASQTEKFNTLIPKVKDCVCPYIYEEDTKTLTFIRSEV